MQINLFNGGLNTRVLPHLIQASEAVKCVNVDTSRGSLVPLKKNKVLNAKAQGSIYKFKGRWVDALEKRDYVEFQEKLFYSNGANRPQWSKDGATFYNVGVAKPTSDQASATFVDGSTELNVKPLFGLIKEDFSGIRQTKVQTGNNFEAQKLRVFKTFKGKVYEEGDTDSSAGKEADFTWESEYKNLTSIDCLEVYYLVTPQYRWSITYFGTPVAQDPFPGGGFRPPLSPPPSKSQDWEPPVPVHSLRGSTGWYVSVNEDNFKSQDLGYQLYNSNEREKVGSEGAWVSGNPDAYFPGTKIEQWRDVNQRGYVGNNKGDQEKNPEIAIPFGPRQGAEAAIVIYNENKEIKGVNLFKIPDKFEATISDPKGSYFAGFSFEWVYEETDRLELFIDGSFYSEINHDSVENQRVKVPYVLKEKKGQRTLSEAMGVLESLQYVVTYESFTGDESAASDVLSVPKLADGSVSYPLIVVKPSDDPQVRYINIYRKGGNFTEFIRIARLSNEAVNFVDTVGETSVDGTVLETLSKALPPDGLQYLTSYSAMLFGALDDKVYFSAVGDPFFWDAFGFIDFEANITGLGPTPNGLLVFTSSRTYILTGNSPSTLSKYLVSGSVGCAGHSSIQTLSSSLIWLANDGLYVSTGGQVQAFSNQKLADMDFGTPLASVVKGDMYLLSFTTGTLLADLRFGSSLVTLNSKFKSLTQAEGKIYGCTDMGELVELFGASDPEELEYITPQYSDGSISSIKVYKNVKFFSNGKMKVKISITGQKVTEQDLNEGFTEVLIPQSNVRGYFIQFEFKGTGEVKEIYYEAERSTT